MGTNETPHDACVRGLTEELGRYVADGEIRVLPSSLVCWEETIESPSYPSLVTRYSLHQMDASVSGLPTTSFVTYERGGKEAPKEHFWRWRHDGRDDLRRKVPVKVELPTTHALSKCVQREIDEFLVDHGWFREVDGFLQDSASVASPHRLQSAADARHSKLDHFLQQNGWDDIRAPEVVEQYDRPETVMERLRRQITNSSFRSDGK
eukprot:1597144-Prymnesium_polylepis.2